MTDARSVVLGRIKAALETAVLPSLPEPRAKAAGAQPDRAALVAAFSREAEALGCVVHGPVGNAEATDVCCAIAREAHASEVLAWNAEELAPPGLRAHLIEQGCHLRSGELPEQGSAREPRLRALAACAVGLTGALAGLADSGSLVLASGPGRPRLSWLLPPVHIALLPVARILPGLDGFLATAGDAVRASAHLALVTGPSRTADIELILTRGVHGPSAVHVVLLA